MDPKAAPLWVSNLPPFIYHLRWHPPHPVRVPCSPLPPAPQELVKTPHKVFIRGRVGRKESASFCRFGHRFGFTGHPEGRSANPGRVKAIGTGREGEKKKCFLEPVLLLTQMEVVQRFTCKDSQGKRTSCLSSPLLQRSRRAQGTLAATAKAAIPGLPPCARPRFPGNSLPAPGSPPCQPSARLPFPFPSSCHPRGTCLPFSLSPVPPTGLGSTAAVPPLQAAVAYKSREPLRQGRKSSRRILELVVRLAQPCSLAPSAYKLGARGRSRLRSSRNETGRLKTVSQHLF